MMPADADLACYAHPQPFDAVLMITDRANATSPRSRRIIAAAKAICGTCEHTVACLRENGDAAGVVGGLSASERGVMG